MTHPGRRLWAAAVGVLAVALGACAPAAPPSPTSAPAKPAATAAPTAAPAAQPTAKPVAAQPTAKPAAATAPTAAPAAKPTEAAKPAAKAETKDADDFFKGKTIKIIVGVGAGGGLDTYARLISRHLPKHISGSPAVIVENMVGAGSLVAANTVFNTAPKDGTTIAHFLGTQVVQELVGNQAVKFEATKFNWIGAPAPVVTACGVSKASGFNRVDEAKGSRELIFGGTAPGGGTDDIPALMKNVLGLNVKLVSGYAGTAQIRLAIEKGEVMGVCENISAMFQGWAQLKAGEAKVIAVAEREKHPLAPDAQLLGELAKTEDDRKIIEARGTLPRDFLYPYALPPGVPAERVQTLRRAFQAALKDPELLAEAKKADIDIDPVTGERIEKAIGELFQLSPQLRERLKSGMAYPQS